MTTLQEQWAQDNKTWWRSVSTNGAQQIGRFTFCFANRWATQKNFLYVIHNFGVISTEQFLSSQFQTIPGFKVRHAVAPDVNNTYSPTLAVGENGTLYVSNELGLQYVDETGAAKAWPAIGQPVPPFNFLGSGPLSADLERDVESELAPRRNSRFFVRSLRPVIGDSESFQDVRFLEVAKSAATCVALSEDGHLWYAGNATADFIEPASSFPDSNGNLNYFRESQATEYIDSTGTVTPDDAIQFQHIWGGASALLAMAIDGRLFIKGSRFWLGQLRESRTFYEISGFVDEVSITAGGSGYTSTPTVTVSAPDNADGSIAVVSAVQTSGVVTSLRLLDSGWGYTSAPTLTISGGGGSGATATATLFTDTWQHADMIFSPGPAMCVAAVSSEGTIYAWGDKVLNPNTFNNDTQLVNSPQRMRGQTHSNYVSVALITGDNIVASGAALTSDGLIETWGRSNTASERITPDKSNQDNLTTYVSSDVFVKVDGGKQMMALLTDDGRVLTYGNNGIYTGRANSTGLSNAHLSIGQIDGDAQWSNIFLFQDLMILVREEEVDSLGNRVNPLPPIFGPYAIH